MLVRSSKLLRLPVQHQSGRWISGSDRSIRSPSAPTYTEEQQRLGRPLSPALTIYKQDITAISSILNRVSGVSLSMGFGALSLIAVGGGDVAGTIHSTLAAAPHAATPIVKFLVAYPAIYHWLSGARHAFWDWKPGYITLMCGPRSSRALIGLTLALSGVASAVTLAPAQP